MILGAAGSHVIVYVVLALVVARIGYRLARRQRARAGPAETARRPPPARPEDTTPPSAGAHVPGGDAAEAVQGPAATNHATPRDPSASPDGTSAPVLDVRGVTVDYGPVRAVDGVSFAILAREIFGLLGPNGAGKTTTLGVVEGLVRPRSGAVNFDGADVRADPRRARARMGIQLQSTSFQSELSITQIVRLFASLYGVDRTDAEIATGLASIGLETAAERPYKQLSGGQQQRLSLHVATIHEPDLLLLDEPTVGLDPQSRRHLWSGIERIRDAGGAVLLTTHSMEEAQAVCDRVAIMDFGRVIAVGAPTALIAAHRDDPAVRAAARGAVTLEDVFIGLTGSAVRE